MSAGTPANRTTVVRPSGLLEPPSLQAGATADIRPAAGGSVRPALESIRTAPSTTTAAMQLARAAGADAHETSNTALAATADTRFICLLRTVRRSITGIEAPPP